MLKNKYILIGAFTLSIFVTSLFSIFIYRDSLANTIYGTQSMFAISQIPSDMQKQDAK